MVVGSSEPSSDSLRLILVPVRRFMPTPGCNSASYRVTRKFPPRIAGSQKNKSPRTSRDPCLQPLHVDQNSYRIANSISRWPPLGPAVEVGCPKVLGDVGSSERKTSLKLTVLNTLKAVTRNCKRCRASFQGILKLLYTPMSVAKYAGPRKTLREPSPPGSVGAIVFTTEAGSANRFGKHPVEPSPDPRQRPKLVLTLCCRVPADVRKKLVGKLNPFEGLSGKPLWMRKVPLHCQPPITASSKRPAPLPNFFPVPKGRSASQKPLTLCLRSKSEGARLALKSNGF